MRVVVETARKQSKDWWDDLPKSSSEYLNCYWDYKNRQSNCQSDFAWKSILDPSSGQCAIPFRIVWEVIWCKRYRPVLDDQPYLPGLAPGSSICFKRLNRCWRGSNQTIESVQIQVVVSFHKLTQEGFPHCFAYLKIRMVRYKDRQEDDIGGDKVLDVMGDE